MATEEMAEIMRKELLEGCDGSDIKAGVIGEIGCSWPLACKREALVFSCVDLQVYGCIYVP